MTCYHPIQAYKTPTGVVFQELARHDIIAAIKLPCGQCIGCRMRRASDWELRITHEAQLWPQNCFVTLTYGRNQLPPNGSLQHDDYQRFMKRLRKTHGLPVRFYMCGEYGPLNQRPHYHACLFNIDFHDRIEAGKSKSGAKLYSSATLDKIWTHGRTSVQDLTPETASYCARYIMTKQLGPNADYGERVPEYNMMSLKPGIGANWLRAFRSDVYTHDHVISRNHERRPPKYYDKLQAKHDPTTFEQTQFNREQNARLTAHDQTPERLQVRENVHLAKVRTLARNLDHDDA